MVVVADVFFFQAEDGIRDDLVTGVQTCALPIFFGGEIRRRDVFPLLVLHLIAREPAYGNRLIEEIEEITDGVISVNPNTIYPLLRELESRRLIEGQWEHPDRRTCRFYS